MGWYGHGHVAFDGRSYGSGISQGPHGPFPYHKNAQWTFHIASVLALTQQFLEEAGNSTDRQTQTRARRRFDDGNEVDKGHTEKAENGSKETVLTRVRSASLYRPPVGIHIPLCLSRLLLGAEAQFWRWSWRRIRRRRWRGGWRWRLSIFRYSSGCADGTGWGGVAESVLELEAEDDFFPKCAVVVGYFGSCRVPFHRFIGLVWKLGGNTVIFFCMTAQTRGGAYYIGGGGVLCWWRCTLFLEDTEAKGEVGLICEEVY